MMRATMMLAVLLAALSPGPARADDAEKPWVRGVSKELKAKAQSLLEQGNVLFLENRHKEALALYEQALAAWDHPAIRFNAVRALVVLDRPVAAQENLEKALAYGPEPLEDAVYREALNYQRLLAGMIGELEIRCGQPGVTVRVNGAVLLTCPGVHKQRMTPGKHVVSGSGDRLLARTIDAVVTPGKLESIEVTLAPLDDLVAHSRWTPWKPWAVVGAGVVLVGVGAVFRVKARSESDEIEAIVRDRCQASCTPDQHGLGDRQDRVDRNNALWTTGLVVGATAVATGLTLVILNRPQVRARETRVVATGASGDELGFAVAGTF
jgi:hypothetical protein